MLKPSQKAIYELKDLLINEKEEDFRQYQHKLSLNSIEDRRKAGVTWYPLLLTKQSYGTGDRVSLSFSKTKTDGYGHQFQVGSTVNLFKEEAKAVKHCGAVVAYIKNDQIRVILQGNEMPDWIDDGKIGINLLFDEYTYKEMDRALEQVASAETGRIATLREIIYGSITPGFGKGHDIEIPGLNTSQNDALNKTLKALDIAVIHGPPGTGKTTTLIQAIKSTIEVEKQVLMCAPSNAAVDLLVERLVQQGINTLRMGHPARLTETVLENSLDVKIAKHPSFKTLKENRKKADELRKIAFQYKRNFGKEERRQRERLKQESKFIKKYSREIEQYIVDDLLSSVSVIACTITGANQLYLKDKMFKTVFIDEGSQALEPACWIPVLKAQRVIMAGDHCQLPPTIKSIKAAKAGLEVSLFERAMQVPEMATMLSLQYRMAPLILGFSSHYFYNSKLQTAQSVLERDFPIDVKFIDTAGCSFEEKIDPVSLSTYNQGEADLLCRHLKANLLDIEDKIGVIAPYRAQIKLLDSLISQDPDLVSALVEKQCISINTVDAFQGQERDTIYISLVRSNDQSEIGFLKEYRRMNVAITRAKSRLFIIGDSATLSGTGFYNQLITYFDENGCYASAFEYLH